MRANAPALLGGRSRRAPRGDHPVLPCGAWCLLFLVAPAFSPARQKLTPLAGAPGGRLLGAAPGSRSPPQRPYGHRAPETPRTPVNRSLCCGSSFNTALCRTFALPARIAAPRSLLSERTRSGTPPPGVPPSAPGSLLLRSRRPTLRPRAKVRVTLSLFYSIFIAYLPYPSW